MCNPAMSSGTCCNKIQCYRLPPCVVLIMICCGLSNRLPHLCSHELALISVLPQVSKEADTDIFSVSKFGKDINSNYST